MTPDLYQAMLAALSSPDDASYASPATFYLSHSVAAAIQPRVPMVIGDAGAGRSSMVAALLSPALRASISEGFEALGDLKQQPSLQNLEVAVGFSKEPSADHPDAASIRDLLATGADPEDIWYAVITRWIARLTGEGGDGSNMPITRRTGIDLPASLSLREVMAFNRNHPSVVARMMVGSKASLHGNHGLILFTDIETITDDIRDRTRLVRGLCQTLLDLRKFPWLHGKAFFDDKTLNPHWRYGYVGDFTDYSKLRASGRTLSWSPNDGFGMIFHRLINAPGAHGVALRDFFKNALGEETWQEKSGIFYAPRGKAAAWLRAVLPTEAHDEMTPARLAAPFHGRPYSTRKSFLNPRLFLVAFSHAVEAAQVRQAKKAASVGVQCLLTRKDLKAGFAKGAALLAQEMASSAPRSYQLLKTLESQTVPTTIWEAINMLDSTVAVKNGPDGGRHIVGELEQDGWIVFKSVYIQLSPAAKAIFRKLSEAAEMKAPSARSRAHRSR